MNLFLIPKNKYTSKGFSSKTVQYTIKEGVLSTS